MPVVKANDINLYYEVHGQGFPLVLIAGIGYHSGCWFSVLPHFSRELQVVVFDNRGVGRSDEPVMDYSIEMFADDTAGLLRAIGITRAHVLGRSMGGAIAQQMALRHPEMVEKLVLVSTLSETSPFGLLVLDVWQQVGLKAGMDVLHKLLVMESLSPRFFGQRPEVVDEILHRGGEHPQPAEAFVRQAGAVARHNATPLLHRIKAPTLVLAGEKDIPTPVGASKLLASRIPNARFRVVPRVGHGFMWEDPEGFCREVLSFLAERPENQKTAG
jgi:pimeloyl-ACP methyl ester carboxylesterase